MPQKVYTITATIHDRQFYKATFYDITYGLKLAVQATKQLWSEHPDLNLSEYANLNIIIDPHYKDIGEFITFVG